MGPKQYADMLQEYLRRVCSMVRYEEYRYRTPPLGTQLELSFTKRSQLWRVDEVKVQLEDAFAVMVKFRVVGRGWGAFTVGVYPGMSREVLGNWLMVVREELENYLERLGP